jgi:hypothetical protein
VRYQQTNDRTVFLSDRVHSSSAGRCMQRRVVKLALTLVRVRAVQEVLPEGNGNTRLEHHVNHVEPVRTKCACGDPAKRVRDVPHILRSRGLEEFAHFFGSSFVSRPKSALRNRIGEVDIEKAEHGSRSFP